MLAAVPVITAVVYVLPDAVTTTTLVTVVDADADVDSVTEADSEADSVAVSVAEADSEADSDAVSVAVSVADAVSAAVSVAVVDVVSVTVVDVDTVSVALSVAVTVVVEEADKEEELETGAPSVILNGARPSEGYAMPAKEQEASPEVLEVWKPGGFASAYFFCWGRGKEETYMARMS